MPGLGEVMDSASASRMFRRLSDRTGPRRPELRPEVIRGMLRQGHKLMIVGPSKLGKSWNSIALAYAVANGGEWLGFSCEQGEVCLVDGEMDPDSFDNRCDRVARALWPGDDGAATMARGARISVVSLRGTGMGMSGLMRELRAYYGDRPPELVIIDPIYKLEEGDENSNSDMREFVAGLDAIASWSLAEGDAPRADGPAVAFTHHSAKGGVGGRAVEDSGSGAGVFGRDPDAIVRMAPIEIADGSPELVAVASHLGGTPEESREAAHEARCVRVRASLREFANPEPMDMVFRFPLFERVAGLSGAPEQGSPDAGRQRGAQANRDAATARWEDLDLLVQEAVEACEARHVTPTRRAVWAELARVCEEDGEVPRPSFESFKRATKAGGRSAWVASATAPYALSRRDG